MRNNGGLVSGMRMVWSDKDGISIVESLEQGLGDGVCRLPGAHKRDFNNTRTICAESLNNKSENSVRACRRQGIRTLLGCEISILGILVNLKSKEIIL